MWGAIAGITAASLALAVLHQTLEASGRAPQQPQKPGELPPPGPDFKKQPGKPERLGSVLTAMFSRIGRTIV
jgi:hypothetical protein